MTPTLQAAVQPLHEVAVLHAPVHALLHEIVLLNDEQVHDTLSEVEFVEIVEFMEIVEFAEVVEFAGIDEFVDFRNDG